MPHLPVHKASLRIVLYTISNKKIKPSNSFVFPGAPSGPYDIREELRFASVRSCYRQSRGLLGGGISTSQGRYIQTQTSMPRMGFEPRIPVFERARAVHVLDRKATMIDDKSLYKLRKRLSQIRVDARNALELYSHIHGSSVTHLYWPVIFPQSNNDYACLILFTTA